MTIPAAGEALKRLLGRQEASTSMVHLDYLNNQHKKTHLIEWMWEDNEHNKINGVVKQCQMMSPGSQLDPCHSAGLVGLYCLLQVACSVPCLCSTFPHYSAHFPNLDSPTPTPTPTPLLLKRHSEWMGFNSCCLDGLPMQFFKTHFTDTTGAIKDPQRNISIEECLYFALIVHLLWQTSNSRISALLNAIYCGMRCFDETSWISMPLLHWESAREIIRAEAAKQHNQINKKGVDLDILGW